MFEEAPADLTFPSWLLQTLLAFCGPLLILAVPEVLLNTPDSVLFQIFAYFALALISGGLAYGVSLVAPASMRAGSVVWILPLSLEILGFFSELLSQGFKSASEAFLVPSGNGEAMWVLVLFTWPTWSCCCYSATAWLRIRRKNAFGSN
jgi:hypothetical protein